MAHPAQILAVGGAALLAFATGATAQPAPSAPPAYVCYIAPCDSPGAIAAGPAASDPSAANTGPPVCLVPVATTAAAAIRSRYSSYSDP
jgi:hypothetical protein